MKTTPNPAETEPMKDRLERVGAGILAGMAMLVSAELVLQHAPDGDKRSHESGHAAPAEIFARGEGKGETARLPEEFDIGLQTPHVAGL